jgi:SpoVK/Ycf46/Vps4 family AAA+-type ATPase
VRSQKEFVDALQQRFGEALLTLRTNSTLNMVCRDSDYYLYPFEIKKPTIDIELNYGSKFMEVHEKIMKALSTKDKQGVVLLHGLPGTGKTHYIRFLINSLKEKELIYVPPDMAYALSSPDFLPFLMKHTNAVLIIEDAENIIKDRQYQDNQAVANLLNLSDGLLGDCLNLQIIATFNSDITRIDSALLRKGRLIVDWKFDKLELEQAQKLAQQLGYEAEITENMTLAEIYGLNEQLITTKADTAEKKKIGF